ncbi:immunity 51 family protein [Tenacibaculum finnmarkense genomovar ulcerans]|uniref:Imm51 family immunity protein n=1 Tax=Tenacibaculum finnmarkense TaxID=2781243 RepID=UPI001E3BBCEC|nr:Imm51 family immunity protein [Tenacibaculum finnmarkense]MCD8433596.1 immunity 51 family protein [Tenacibaculum finnmarkense genomovar ulcerans]
MEEENIYFPCLFMKHEDDNFSIICSEFHYFDDYFGEKGGGGYTVQKVAKKIAKENTIKGIKYDSEAGMFCAYSNTSENLLELCILLREITGDEDKHLSEIVEPLISFEKAEKLVLKGFVKSLDEKAQKDFLKNVPMPSLSKQQSKYLNDIQHGTDKEKIYSAKRINSEARTYTRNWDNYLSHPNTITFFLEAIDREENPKVYQELLWALVFICGRHLPDLRTKPYFLKALENKIGNIRWLGIIGLNRIYDFPFERLVPLIKDKTYKVREKLVKMLSPTNNDFAIWMFDPIQKKVNNKPKDLLPYFTLFSDKHRSVQIEAIGTLLKLKEEQIFPKLKELIPFYKTMLINEEATYLNEDIKNVIEKLEKIK